MSLAEIISEVDQMGADARRKLLAHLVRAQVREDQSYRKELFDRKADERPESWVSLQELKQRVHEA